MIKFTFSFLLLLLCSLLSNAQQLSGVITNSEGDPIPFANIYVKALSTGTTSNLEGEYQLDLPVGNWDLSYRYLGYKTKKIQVSIEDKNIQMNVQLTAQTYQLKEVKVLASGEDPAYYVMRKAIAMGDYYTKQVSEYNNKVYLKGSGKVMKIPRLLKKKLAEKGITENKTYVTENISKIHFELPDKLEEEVISIRSSGLSNETNPMQFVTTNLYNTRDYGFISPLDKNAFSVYKYQLESIFEDQERMINRIKITPKRKGKDLFHGYINIRENYWNIHSADLKLSLPMAEVQMHQLYAPVTGDVWMPISFDFNIEFQGMGFEVNGMYVASIKDYQTVLNPDLDHEFLTQQAIADQQEKEVIENITNQSESKPLSAKEKKRKETIQVLLEKDDMNNADMHKLQRLMAKETQKIQKEKVKEPLEIKIDKVKIAKGAKDKDSLYWDKMRPIPLSTDEKISFTQKDSIVEVMNTPEYKDSVRSARREFKFRHLVFGKTYQYEEENSELSTPGILSIGKISYNTVQGFAFNAPFLYSKHDTTGHYFEISPDFTYAFSRKHIDFSIGSKYRYNGMKRAWLGFKTGSEAVDFNGESGINPLLNTVTSLFYKDNYLKLYDKNYINLWHSFDIINSLNLHTKIEYANRKQLYNNNSFYISDPDDQDYSPNIPSGIDPELVRNSKAFTFTAQLEYTPRRRYCVDKGAKKMIGYHKKPTLTLLFKKGFKDVLNSETDYSLLEASVKQEISIGFSDYLTYHLRAGSFLSQKQIFFADYRHFNTNKPGLMIGSDMTTFRLLDYYKHSNHDDYAEAHLQYTSDRFLLKRLPVLNNSLALQERLFANYLTHNDKNNYWEAGYGLSQIFLLLDVEVVWSFDGKHHSDTGVKLKFNF